MNSKFIRDALFWAKWVGIIWLCLFVLIVLLAWLRGLFILIAVGTLLGFMVFGDAIQRDLNAYRRKHNE